MEVRQTSLGESPLVILGSGFENLLALSVKCSFNMMQGACKLFFYEKEDLLLLC